jgi:hypothetical protein
MSFSDLDPKIFASNLSIAIIKISSLSNLFARRSDLRSRAELKGYKGKDLARQL